MRLQAQAGSTRVFYSFLYNFKRLQAPSALIAIRFDIDTLGKNFSRWQPDVRGYVLPYF
jgi:hypothetical protein